MPEDAVQQQILITLGEIKVSMSEFHAKTTVMLGVLDAATKKTNGSVLHHSEQLAAIPISLMTHAATCPISTRLGTVEAYVIGQKATSTNNSHWVNRLWPIIYAAGGIAIYMAALHANDLLKAMRAIHGE